MKQNADRVQTQGLLNSIKGEVGRRLVHSSGAVIPLAYLAGVEWQYIQIATIVLVLGAAVLETIRLQIGLQWWIYEHLTREYEQDSIAGYALYAVGMATVALLFSPEIAVPAMLILAIADPIAGALAGEDPIPIKRPVALIGMFLLSFLFAVLFLPTVVAVVVGVAATIADGVFMEIRGFVIDDNLSLPIFAAVGGWIASIII
ncbi:dolichol kinase [Salinarchaeum sp. IM2453]|uniref:dolichol kinase n=1 Tax=Salinarchaeum sp. IM2453 TaxID=2862870 RepID=UPI002106DD1C|nr:dolichol kinase [Salinarchaeum sp. IM2453]